MKFERKGYSTGCGNDRWRKDRGKLHFLFSIIIPLSCALKYCALADKNINTMMNLELIIMLLFNKFIEVEVRRLKFFKSPHLHFYFNTLVCFFLQTFGCQAA